MRLTDQQLTYLRRLYRVCGPKPGPCAESRAVARMIGATEDEPMDIEEALAQHGYIEVAERPGTVALTDAGRKRALR
jgi:Mn-dependent DtxR family transcriptional regulator